MAASPWGLGCRGVAPAAAKGPWMHRGGTGSSFTLHQGAWMQKGSTAASPIGGGKRKQLVSGEEESGHRWLEGDM
jgi:hypothetical protein